MFYFFFSFSHLLKREDIINQQRRGNKKKKHPSGSSRKRQRHYILSEKRCSLSFVRSFTFTVPTEMPSSTTAVSCPVNSGGAAMGNHSHQLTSPSTLRAAQAGPPLQLQSRGGLGTNHAPLQEQLPPHQRNKAVICKSFIENRCTTLRDECPYLHALLDEARSVPERACRYFMQGACLRGTCPFFHGTQSELKSLIRSHGASGTYTLRDLNLAVLDPPRPASLQHPPLLVPGHMPLPMMTTMMPTATVVLAPPPHHAFAATAIPHISTTDLSSPADTSQRGCAGGHAFGQPASQAAGSSTMMTNTNLLHLQQQHYAYHGRNESSPSSHHCSVLSRASSNLSAVSTGSRNHQSNSSLSLHEVEDAGASLVSLLMLPPGEPSTSTTTPPYHAPTAATAAAQPQAGGGVPSHFLQAPPRMWVSPASSSTSSVLPLLHHPHPGNSSGQYTAFSSASSFASHARGSSSSPFQAQHNFIPVASAQPQQYRAMGQCYVLPGGEAQVHAGSGGLSEAQLQQHQQEFLLSSSSSFPATAGMDLNAALQQSASPTFVGFDPGPSAGGWGVHQWTMAPHHVALTQLLPTHQQNPAFLWLGPQQFQDPTLFVLPMRQHEAQHQQPFLVPRGAMPESSSSPSAQANVSAFAADGELHGSSTHNA
jgi:hypothetical protein